MADLATVRGALSQLDPGKDDHWTSQGLPRMDVLAGIGLTIDRRELNELVPGFSRAVAKKALEEATPEQQAERASLAVAEANHADDTRRHADATFRHMLERAERRKAALEHLAAGGFTVADLADTTSPLQRRISSQNRSARRELS